MLETPSNRCTGCSACFNRCPAGAISMQRDEEGFLYPHVDDAKCTKCDLCNEICPALESRFINDTVQNPICIAGWSADEAERKESSSGGVFSLLAENVIERGGSVCGAAFDANCTLRHILTSTKEDIYELRGSKYLQSDTRDIYKTIKNTLDSNYPVLFSGTPCQVGGLYGFLGRDDDNLLTVDILCHGVPSPLVFKKYLKEISGSGNQIESISFRDKSSGWKGYCFLVNFFKNGVKTRHSKDLKTDSYMKGFLNDLYLRPCCHNCRYTETQRVADVTLGDFWGIGSYRKRLDDDRGTSLILLNNPKGERVFENIRDKMKKTKKVPLKVAVKGNSTLIRPFSPHPHRKSFFRKLQTASNVSHLIEEELDGKSVGIMNLHYSDNFGAVLVAYALSKAVGKLGFNPSIVNYIHQEKGRNDSPVFEAFRRKFLSQTALCKSERDLRKLNRQFNKFIVGSDQVFRLHSNFKYFLYWVTGRKTVTSYAASFGIDIFKGTEIELNKAQALLSRFDAISVREKSGVDICRETFNVSAEHVLDPTLLLDSSDYQDIIDQEGVKEIPKKYIAYMLLDEDNERGIQGENTLAHLKTDYTFINLLKDDHSQFRTVAQWLHTIKNAECIITDSFHCTVFSILFGKPFACVEREWAGNNRIHSLFETLAIKEKLFYDSFDRIPENIFEKSLNYEAVYKNLNHQRDRSFSFIRKCLTLKPVEKRYYPSENTLYFRFMKVPLLGFENKKNKIKVYLFGIIPFLKIKYLGNGKMKVTL